MRPDADLMTLFVGEARDLMDEAARGLLSLERDGDGDEGSDALMSIFRAMHTLKGASGLFEIGAFTRLVHHMEDLLSRLRARETTLSAQMTDVLLEATDQLGAWVDALEKERTLPDGAQAQADRLLERLLAVSGGALAGSRSPQTVAAGLGAPLVNVEVKVRYSPDPHCYFRGEDPLRLALQIPDLRTLEVVLADPGHPQALDPYHCRLEFVAVSGADLAELDHHFRYVSDQVRLEAVDNQPVEAAEGVTSPAGAASVVGSPKATGSGAMLRVEQARVDHLMNLIGELIVIKNSLPYLARRVEAQDASPRQLAQEVREREAQVNRVAEELQSAVLAVRMTPMSQVFQRFPRLVRDTARKLDKQVELIIEGETAEADKNIVEALADPLIHAVRNALDHGLEAPAARRAAQKSECGRIWLSARQDNETICVTVRDDGQGIDPQRVRQRALERGLISPEGALGLSDAEAIQLVFLPGFSTAETVSDLSGRGVGMDAVRVAIERLGGEVAMRSAIGEGSTLAMTLPLSVAIAQIMTIRMADGRRFGVPLAAVVETLKIDSGQIHQVKDGEAFVLRDRLVPLRRLHRILDIPEVGRPSQQAVLVTRAGGDLVGLAVAGFGEGMKAIIKPLEGALAGARGFSGATVTGDGKVLLVLDLKELVQCR